MAKILIVEDELDLAQPVANWLKHEDNLVEIAENGRDALDRLRVYKYDLIILDWLLPFVTGVEVCRQFRDAGGTTPILMLTARDSVDDKTLGLDTGADDYLTKPFHLKELAARVRALLRRPQTTVPQIISVRNIVIDTGLRRVTRNGQEVHLLPREFSLLEFLMVHANQTYSAEALLDRIWESDTLASTDTVRTHIKTIRRKLDETGAPSIISTVHGVGYMVEVP